MSPIRANEFVFQMKQGIMDAMNNSSTSAPTLIH